MQWVIALLRQKAVSVYHGRHVRGLYRDDYIVKIAGFENMYMAHSAFNERFGGGRAVFRKKFFFQRAAVYADPYRYAARGAGF